MPDDPDQHSGFTDPDKTDSLPILGEMPVDAGVKAVAVGQAAPQVPGKQHAEELRSLADALQSRDATILQMLETMEARVAELAALRGEYERTRSSLAIANRGGGSIGDDGQAELRALRAQAAAYLELLQTREWRREYRMNLFLAGSDAGPGAPNEVARVTSIADGGREAPLAADATPAERALIETLTSQNAALRAQTAALLSKAQVLQDAMAERDAQLAAQAVATEEQLTVLLAHLHEARRSLQEADAERRRLAHELATSADRANALAADNRELQAAIEAKRSSIPSRASAHAAAAIEPLDASEDVGAAIEQATNEANFCAEFVRIDGQRRVAYRVGPRSRIGRATDCELRIDIPSVSRHHALVLIGSRECIIEDLRSTNGTFVNGRMIVRQQLNDGDLVTIGEVQFEFASRPAGHRAD